MQIALGRDEATEYAQNLHLISERITGQVGLMFTNEPAAKVEAFFKTYAVSGYARSGFKATRKVVLDAGPYEDLFDASQQPNLQKRRIYVPELNRYVSVRLSTKGLKTVDKKGPYKALKDAGLI